MAIKVHGHPLSPPTKRVLLSLQEKGLAFEFVLVDLRTRQHKTQSFLALNPFGQIPAMEDGDLKLFESRAISRYVAEAYADRGTQLVRSDDPKEAALVSVWSEVESLRFDPVASKLMYEILIKPLLGMPTDDAAVDAEEGKLGPILDAYEARLSESKYLAGDEFSLADMNHIPVVHNLYATKVKALFEARPRVRAWSEALLARPAWIEVISTYNYRIIDHSGIPPTTGTWKN